MTVEEWLGKENTLGKDIWERKYRYNGESFDEWVERVSGGDEDVASLIRERKFLPGGRTIANIGTDTKASMSNCYSYGYVEDDYSDIMEAAVKIGKTFKAQGGQGLSLSKLRPKGTPIGTQYESDGILPFMKIYNEVTAGTSQGGSRKGALLMSLDAWHKEAMNFITLKSEQNVVEKANLSLEVDDEFMRCVEHYFETGETLTIHRSMEYSGHIVEWNVAPIEVFKALVHNNYDWGDPGCLFVDCFRNYNIMEYCDDYEIQTCNPCGEQPLPKNGSCNLGSINLSEFVNNPYETNASFNYAEFSRAIGIAVRYLDSIIDLNADRHPLREQKELALNYRNIGLGVFGYASMLMKLGLKYGESNAIEFTGDLFNFMFKKAVLASSKNAEKLGSFPKYSEKVWESNIVRCHFSDPEIDDLKNQGLRNCSLLSIAPCGTLATMLNESSGIEPEFAISYTRRTVGLTDNEDRYYKVYCKSAREYMELTGQDKLPNHFVSAHDIDAIKRIMTQARIQRHIDTAISSTVNVKEDFTEEEMQKVYLESWRRGLKGITIFRDKCKRVGILTTEDSKKQDEHEGREEEKRGFVWKVSNDAIGLERHLTTGCGSLHCSAFFDSKTGELLETYLSKGSQGGCLSSLTGLSRMISIAARGGVSSDDIVDQLLSTVSCPSYAVRRATKKDTSVGDCCPSAVGRAIKEMSKEIKRLIGENGGTPAHSIEEVNDHDDAVSRCPECGEELVFEGGCVVCKCCGYSKC